MTAPFGSTGDRADAGYAEFRRAIVHALRRGIVAADRRAGEAGRDDPLLPVTMSDAWTSGADWMTALADAWAMVGDILRFYRGRIAAEAYVATAGDDAAIEMLLGSIGHARDPGSAATALVSLSLAAGADAPVVAPRGTRMQTVPGPGQTPTMFQTDDDLIARPAWNRIAMTPLSPPPPPAVDPGAARLILAGPVRSIGPGSVIHIGATSAIGEATKPVAGALRLVSKIVGVPRDAAPSDTLVTLVPLAHPVVVAAGSAAPIVSRFDLRTKMFGAHAPAWEKLPLRTRLAIGRVDGGVSVRAHDGGWTPANTGLAAPLPGPLVALAADRLIAAGPTGLIGWTDGSWRTVAGGAPTTPVTALRLGEGGVYAGTVDGRLFVSADGGDSWDEIDAPAVPPARRLLPPFTRPGALPKVPVRAIAAVGDAIIVASDAGVWRSTGAGAGWLAWSEGLGASGDAAGPVAALIAGPDGTLFAGGATGLFARSPDARRWTRYDAPTDPIRDLAVVNGTVVALIAAGLRLTGAEPTSIWSIAAGAPPHSIAAGDGVLAAAAASGLHLSTDNGQQWVSPAGDETHPIVRVAIAPDGALVRAAATLRPADTEWPGFHAADGVIDLAGEAPEIIAGSLVAVLTADRSATYRVTRAETVHRVDFGLDATVTRLSVAGGDLPLASLDLRTTDIVAIDRPLATAAVQATPSPSLAVAETALTPVDPTTPTLPPGRPTILTGGGVAPAPVARQSAVLVAPALVAPPPLSAPLELHGNVVAATEGRTITGEVLGDGDPSIAHQQFTLSTGPLTHVDGGDGRAEPIVAATVNGVRWTLASLADAGPDDRVFEVAIAPDGRGVLRFGNGVHGAALPRGRGNVVATYSVGIGGAAPAAGQLTTVLQTPVRLAGVVNPIAGVAGRAPQLGGEALALAPRRWRSSGRLVSLRDYRDAAATAPGVGAARVERLATSRGAILAISVIGVGPADGDLDAVGRADAAAAAAVKALVAARGDDPATVKVRPCRRRAIALAVASTPAASDQAARMATLSRLSDRLAALARATIAGTISTGGLSMALNRSDDPTWLAIVAVEGAARDVATIELDSASWDTATWQLAAAEAAWFAPLALEAAA